MISDDIRSLVGKFGQEGWRPSLIGWGLGSALVALAWAFVYRFAIGATTLADFAALAPIVAIVMQYIAARGPGRRGALPQSPTPEGGLVNNMATA